MGGTLKEAGFFRLEKWFQRVAARPGVRAGVDVLRAEARAQQRQRESEAALPNSVAENLFGKKPKNNRETDAKRTQKHSKL